MAAETDNSVADPELDLTREMAPYLDRHMLLQILQFLATTGMYTQEDLTRSEIELIRGTLMVDLCNDKYKELNQEPPASNEEWRKETLETIRDKRECVLPLLEILEDPERMQRIQQLKSQAELCQEFDLPFDIFDELIKYAKMQYDIASYKMSAELLSRSFTAQEQESPASSKQLNAYWGLLAARTLDGDLEKAAETVQKIDDLLQDSSRMSKRDLLLQRTWLLHWSLFGIFKAPDRKAPDVRLLDFLLSEKNLSLISLTCRHLLRYVSACLILQKRLKHLLKDTVRVIHNEAASYSDPVTRFLLAVYSDMDFDQSQNELQRCKKLCMSDYFLKDHWTDFEEHSRLLIFETYCRIHQCISIPMLATRLNMGVEEAESWIVKLIQQAKLDARIDTEKSRVVMSKAPPSVYQQVIEKTRNLPFRSTMLLSNLEKREKERVGAYAV